MSRLSEKLASMTPRTRQYIMLGGAGTVFLGLVAGSVALWDSQPAVLPTPTTQQPTNISTPGSSVDPKDVWMTQSAAQMKQGQRHQPYHQQIYSNNQFCRSFRQCL